MGQSWRRHPPEFSGWVSGVVKVTPVPLMGGAGGSVGEAKNGFPLSYAPSGIGEMIFFRGF